MWLFSRGAVPSVSSASAAAPAPVASKLVTLIRLPAESTTLDLSNKNLTDTDFETLDTTSLPPSTSILNLNANQIGSAGAKKIAPWVRDCKELSTFNVFANLLGAQGIEYLIEGLRKHPKIQTLNIGFNHLGDNGAQVLARWVVEPSTLKVLNVSLNEIGPLGTAALLNAFSANYMILQLNISHNEMDMQGARALAAWMSNKVAQLLSLDISANKITAAMGEVIFKALKNNQTVATMNMAENQLGDSGVASLSECLKLNEHVRSLNVESNQVGIEGLNKLADAVKTNRRITVLNVSNNITGELGAKAWMTAFQDNFTITNFLMTNCGFSNPDQLTINRFIERNQALAKQLYNCCDTQNYDEVQRLLEKGVSPCSSYAKRNQKSNEESPLHLAARKKDVRLAKMLLDPKYKHQTALLGMQNPKGQTVFDISTELNDQDMLRFLDSTKVTTATIPSLPVMSSGSSRVRSAVSVPAAPAVPTSVVSTGSATSGALTGNAEVVVNFSVDPNDVTDKTLISDKGGFGKVYKAKLDGAVVAVKVLRIDRLSEEAIRDMKQEASIMAKFRSRYLVGLIGISFDPASIYMEFMERGSLHDVVHGKKETLSSQEQGIIVLHIIYALRYLHKNKVVHNDVKGMNVLLKGESQQIEAKLADFGLAKTRMEVFSRSSVSASSTAGTLLWMPPEKLAGAEGTEQSDIYSLGVVMWEMLSGRFPFKAAGTNQALIMHQISNGIYDYNAPQNASVLQLCPAYLQEVMKGFWKKDPKERMALEAATQIVETGNEMQLSLQTGFAPNLLTKRAPSTH